MIRSTILGIAGAGGLGAMALLAAAPGCSVKKTVPVVVPPAILSARSAGLDELVELLRRRDGRIASLSSNSLRVTFTSGRPESGSLQEYRSAPGYLLVQRPASIRVNIQNPVTKTTIVDLLSVGDGFSIWYPRDNKFFTGLNSVREFELGGPSFTARPAHILEAILPEGLDLSPPGSQIAMEEDQDAVARYYILTLYRHSAGPTLYPVRKLWIERSSFTVSRQHTFRERGELASVIHYSQYMQLEDVQLPQAIRLERPADGYSLLLQFKTWRLNPELPEAAFVLAPPGGAERVELKAKTTP